jgi:hypothetical protein
MGVQYSTTHRNNNMADITTQVGASGLLKIFTGTVPTNCATADTGSLLATLTCNATFAPAPVNGVLTANAITGAAASGTGTAGYFRIYPSAATTTNAVLQGTVTATGGGGDMQLGTVSITTGTTVNVTSLTDTAAGA